MAIPVPEHSLCFFHQFISKKKIIKSLPFLRVSRDSFVRFLWSSSFSGFSLDFDNRFLRTIFSSRTIELPGKEDVKTFGQQPEEKILNLTNIKK
jgi:hypothetical protein